MVPSWSTVVDIWLKPFVLLEVELPNVIVLLLGVPTTVNVDLSIESEQTVATTTIWDWTSGVWNNLVPSFCLEIEGIHIVEGDSGVTLSSMSTLKIYLAFVVDCSSVGSWCWGTNL